MIDFNLTQLLKRPQYVLLGLIASLFSVYFALVWRLGDLTHLGISGLFLLVALTLIWENSSNYYYKHERIASIIAMILIGWVLWQSTALTSEHQPELRLIPFVAALAVALLASGFQGLRQYQSELAIMFFLGVPSALLSLIDISPLTASFAATMLWYGGFDVVQRGLFLVSPAGTVQVYAGCSGMESMTYLLGISVVCMTLYPVGRLKQVIAAIAAVGIGFTINAVRVAIMATLAAPDNQTAFLFWHEGLGSLFFGVIEIVLFGLFYWLLYWLEMQKNQQKNNSNQG